MKHLKYLLSLSLIFAFITSSIAHPLDHDHSGIFNSAIEKYLSDIDFENDGQEATVFVNFIVSDHGDLFKVDFIVTENNEIVLLSEDYEEEYYKINNYSTKNLKKYSVPVSNILI